MSKITNILGPVSLTEHFSKEYDRHIYIFGDIHEFNKGCGESDSIKIDKYIQQTLESNSDKVIDIYLEVPYLTKNSPTVEYEYREEAGYLFRHVLPTFTNCLQVYKGSCPYKNARFHYVDIRWLSIDDFTSLEALIQALTQIAKHIEDFWEGKLSKKEERKCLERISKSLKSIYKINLTFDVKNILENTKLLKQIDSVKNKDIKNLLNEQLQKLIKDEHVVQEGFEFIKSMDQLTTEEGRILFMKDEDNLNILYEKMDVIYDKLSEFQSGFMDLFLLARVFRSFKKKFGNTQKDPKYIIIYTGDDHSKIYRNFLDAFKFTKINEVYNEEQCLDISSFKQPFFT